GPPAGRAEHAAGARRAGVPRRQDAGRPGGCPRDPGRPGRQRGPRGTDQPREPGKGVHPMALALNRVPAVLAALLPLAVLAAGCVTIGWDESGKGPPPPDTPCQVVTFWENHVTFAPDPARAGVNAPVLLG